MSKKQTHSVTRYSFVGENRSLLDQYEQAQTKANPRAISTGSISKNHRASGSQDWQIGTTAIPSHAFRKFIICLFSIT